VTVLEIVLVQEFALVTDNEYVILPVAVGVALTGEPVKVDKPPPAVEDHV
jgi:hypothetical protein